MFSRFSSNSRQTALIEFGSIWKYNINRAVSTTNENSITRRQHDAAADLSYIKAVEISLTSFHISNTTTVKRNLFFLWNIRHSPAACGMLIPEREMPTPVASYSMSHLHKSLSPALSITLI